MPAATIFDSSRHDQSNVSARRAHIIAPSNLLLFFDMFASRHVMIHSGAQ
jgi:hypothetical protein